MSMMNQYKVFVNDTQAKFLQGFYERDPVVSICRRFVLRTLLSGGLVFRSAKGNRAKTLTPDFAYVLEHYWVPFLIAVYDGFQKWGLVVWSVETVRIRLPSTPRAKRRVRVPWCLQHGTYRIEVRQSGRHSFPTYHVYRMPRSRLFVADGRPDGTLRVMVCAGHHPSLEGLIRSPLLPLMPGYQWTTQMREYALHVEHARAHPPLITEQRTEAVHQNDVVAVEMFADVNEQQEDKDDITYHKGRVAMEAFTRQVNLANQLNGKRLSDRTLEVDPFTGRVHRKPEFRQQWQEAVFPLPDGQQLARPTPSVARPDLLEFERNRADLVCSAMGVPRSLLMNEGGGGAKGTAVGSNLAYQSFMRSMEAISRELAGHLRWVYRAVYKGDDVRVTFPYLPVVAVEDLVQLGELGLISRDTFGRRMLAAVGLPETDLALQGEALVKRMTLPEHQQKETPPPGKKK
jgi:hypothetical protein